MRRSFFLHLALGLLSWSSQALGASPEHAFPVSLSSHRPRMDGSVEKRNAHPLPSKRKAINAAAGSLNVDE